MGSADDTTKDDPRIERPEDKDMQDHTFGKTMQERTERAERGEPDPGEEPAPGTSGRA
jgi:hypothetical protein